MLSSLTLPDSAVTCRSLNSCPWTLALSSIISQHLATFWSHVFIYKINNSNEQSMGPYMQYSTAGNIWIHFFQYMKLVHCPCSIYIYHIEWFDCLYQYCARILFNRWILKYLQSKLIGLQEKILYTQWMIYPLPLILAGQT